MSTFRMSLAYREVDSAKAIFHLITTLAAYFGCGLSALFYAHNLWVALPFAAVTSVMAVRLYMLQHDCMHRCFIKPKWLNDVIGIALSPFTLTPFYVGRYNHMQHHGHVGDLDHRDTFEINVLTLEEYRALPWRKRLAYRAYRHPLTLLIVGPFVVYAIFNRFPKNTRAQGFVADVFLHNALILLMGIGVFLIAGGTGLWIWGFSVYLAASCGAIIPYVEHNFETVQWGRRPELTHENAALYGSAVLDFGDVFHFLTANIGYHDLHHLNPTIPSYRLKTCHEALEAEGLLASTKIGWREALQCFRWKLWDEKSGRMVGFAAV